MQKKTIPCPACKFPNSPGSSRCLTCKSPLSAPDAEEPQAGGDVAPPTSVKADEEVEEEAVAWLSCDPLPPIPVSSWLGMKACMEPPAGAHMAENPVPRKGDVAQM